MQYTDADDHRRGLPWLYEQEQYQENTFGVDFAAFDEDPEALTTYTTMNLNAAFLELAEAQAETPWKPWATVDKELVWAANRDKFVGELVDVLFFLGNSLIAVGCTDQELAERYAEKMRVNQTRQETGYDGFTTKCPGCQRALDDVAADDAVDVGGEIYCSESCATKALVEFDAVMTLDDDLDVEDGHTVDLEELTP